MSRIFNKLSSSLIAEAACPINCVGPTEIVNKREQIGRRLGCQPFTSRPIWDHIVADGIKDDFDAGLPERLDHRVSEIGRKPKAKAVIVGLT